jgi:hypothetical protein
MVLPGRRRTMQIKLGCIYICLAIVISGCGTGGGGRLGLKDGGVGGEEDGGGGPDDGGTVTDDAFVFPDDGMFVVKDPETCAEATTAKSYVGCDYWPTVTANAVWSVFDYAVVVSNPGKVAADVTVTGPNSVNQIVTVQPNTLQKIYLPWVTELKGGEADAMGSTPPITASVRKNKGAYHLVSTYPVLVYQFNALEYKPAGGPAGKNWGTCPGNGQGGNPPCFSYSNDASLLLPSTAMTGNYRVSTNHGIDGNPGLPPLIPAFPGLRAYFTVTATQDGTTVKVKASSTSGVAAGTGVTAIAANATGTFTMDAGDVIQLVGDAKNSADLSGSLVQSDKPVQVIGGMPCYANPSAACDHIEETVLPAETLGRRYLVTRPTGPKDSAVSHTVRFIGNVDGTQLTFSPALSGGPATLNAGQVVEVDNVSIDFLVQGNHEFIVSTIQKSGSIVDAQGGSMAKGDPSLSSMTAVEQFRLKYVFLAPDDYDVNYADVVAPMGASLTIDGSPVSVSGTAVGSTGLQVFRIKLGAGMGGAHTLESDKPCGLQIEGYGAYTSYQYPAGLNLLSIAPPPPPIS